MTNLSVTEQIIMRLYSEGYDFGDIANRLSMTVNDVKDVVSEINAKCDDFIKLKSERDKNPTVSAKNKSVREKIEKMKQRAAARYTLNQCPFCGSTDVEYDCKYDAIVDRVYYKPQCNGCGCTFKDYFMSKKDAAEAWNVRKG